MPAGTLYKPQRQRRHRKTEFNEWYNGSAPVISLCTCLSQPMQNKLVHRGGIIFIGIKRSLDEFELLVFIDRQVVIKILIHFRTHVAIIFVWDDRGDRGQKN